MAVSPKAVVSWGLLGEPGSGGVTRVIERLVLTLETLEPLEVTLEVTEITVELSDG